ncbi:SphA family protein [Acuticoccus sediminis]|uniref:SphA family protein n=1 Tax=Acuticoccus sediminis TaxID=2184697 RepID=UPI001CFD9E5B|nr:transporter [Acuticoccus sediminis]
MRKRVSVGAILALCAVAAHPAHAEEGGSGHYIPGAFATLMDNPPTDPGLLLQLLYLGYTGSVRASAELPVAGRLTAGLDATVNAVTVGGLYTFEQKILGAYYSFGAYLPVIDKDVTATVTAPDGRSVSLTDRVTGVGDVTLIPAMMAWEIGDFQVSVATPVFAPTGSFKVGHLANPGLNYWTIDPTLALTYNGATNGFNAAVFGGITFNTENQATDYQSGSVLHLEGSVQQLLPLGPGFLGLGANAFLYEQITDDSGPGANVGPLRGRSVGLGPVIDYVLPVKGSTASIEARWLHEFDTRNRLEGDYFWVKGVWQF